MRTFSNTNHAAVKRIFWESVQHLVICILFFLAPVLGGAGFTQAFGAEGAFQCSSLVLQPSLRSFGPVQGQVDHLSLVLPFQPIAALRAQLDSRLGANPPLKTRGEAHVTLITPPELAGIQSIVSLTELKDIATRSGVLTDAIKLECAGRAKVPRAPALGETFFLVVSSSALATFRAQVEKLIQERSPGNTTLKNSPFFPHVTIGFTKKDLHYPDVTKTCEKSFWADVQLMN